jgi:hypothetical protein
MQHPAPVWTRLQPIARSGHQVLLSTPEREVTSKRGRAAAKWTGEVSVRDLLADPIAQALMSADRVKPEDVNRLLATAASAA